MPQMPTRTIFLFMSLALITAGCAAVQPVNSGGPGRNQPPYPVILADTSQRIEAASATWAQLSNQQGVRDKTVPELQPITATIRRLPENLNGSLYLPKVGATTEMSEEETREYLRRFLNEWQKLLGADPAQLSLIQESKNSDGTTTVVYEQRPFTYPLRGDYGKVEVRFAPNRRILGLSSTAIPDTPHTQAALSAAPPRLKAEEIPAKLIGRNFTYSDSTGQHTYTITPSNQPGVQQLVVYPRLTVTKSALEFHLAWEINLANAPVKTIYLDALQDEVIAVSQS
jgi:hypothetical protein